MAEMLDLSGHAKLAVAFIDALKKGQGPESDLVTRRIKRFETIYAHWMENGTSMGRDRWNIERANMYAAAIIKNANPAQFR